MINTLFSSRSSPARSRTSRAVALGGIAWNLFGVVQFAASSFKSVDQLTRSGMTAAQASLYASLPGWMTAAFAGGVLLGLAGSVLLLIRHLAAWPVLLLSLGAYVALFTGDILFGVFEVFGPGQLFVLLLVLTVAAVLVITARPTASAAA